tara:strand:- start:57 stop:248 length:192 start_codon:yes stop_codon:yes gene_type:complete
MSCRPLAVESHIRPGGWTSTRSLDASRTLRRPFDAREVGVHAVRFAIVRVESAGGVEGAPRRA